MSLKLRLSTCAATALLGALWLGGCRQIPLAPEPAGPVQATPSLRVQRAPEPVAAAPALPPAQPTTLTATQPDTIEVPPAVARRDPQKQTPLAGNQARWLPAAQRPEWLNSCFAPRQVDAPVRIQRSAMPQYPQTLIVDDVQGKVVVLFQVSTSGTLEHYLVQPGAHPALVAPSIAALRRWKFSPSTHQGQPASVCFLQMFRYVLEE